MYDLPITYFNNKKKSKYKRGDLVYFVDCFTHKLDWGIVDEELNQGYILKLYELVDRRTIDGIRVQDYPFGQRRRKLPKGWSPQTKLFEIATLSLTEYLGDKVEHYNRLNDTLHTAIGNKMFLKQAVEDKIFVPPSQNCHAYIDTDISTEGWTIVAKYGYYKDLLRSDFACVADEWIFDTYDEANAEVKAYYQELHRQSELSDYDWSVEDIDRTLRKGTNDEERIQRIKDFLLKQKNVEDIVTRWYGGEFQWKYEKNKRWISVVL